MSHPIRVTLLAVLVAGNGALAQTPPEDHTTGVGEPGDAPGRPAGAEISAESMLPMADPWNIGEDYAGIAVADAAWTISKDFPGTKLIVDGRYTLRRSEGEMNSDDCDCGRNAPEVLTGTVDLHAQWGAGETALEYLRLALSGRAYQWDYRASDSNFGRLRDTLEWGVLQGGRDDPLGIDNYAELTIVRGSRNWYRQFERLPLVTIFGIEMSGGYAWASSFDQTYEDVSNPIVGSALRVGVGLPGWGQLYLYDRVINGFTLSSPARGGSVSREARFRFGYTNRFGRCLVLDVFVEKRSFNFSDPALTDLYTKSRRIGAEVGCVF